MANADEADKLQQEITFLTNLISNATNARSNEVHHYRQAPVFSSVDRGSSTRKWVNPSQAATKTTHLDNRASETSSRRTVVNNSNNPSYSLTEQSRNYSSNSFPTQRKNKWFESGSKPASSARVNNANILPSGKYVPKGKLCESRTVIPPRTHSKTYSKTNSKVPSCPPSVKHVPYSGAEIPHSKIYINPAFQPTSSSTHLPAPSSKSANPATSAIRVESKMIQGTKALTGTTSTKPRALTKTASATKSIPDVRTDLEASPDIIEAGKKIIEEIEKLNQAVAKIEKATNSGHGQVKKCVHTRKASPTMKQPGQVNPVKPQTQTAPIAHVGVASAQRSPQANVVKHTRYSLIRKNALDKSSQPHPSSGTPLRQGTSPYKIDKTAYSPSALPSKGPKLTLNKTCKFHVVRNRENTPKIKRTALAQNSKWTPRRGVYVTRNKLQTVYSTKFKIVKKTSDAARSPDQGRKSQNGASHLHSNVGKKETVQKRSAVVSELLKDLSFIDIALKTAKLQSSQKLVRKAVMTKQKMMQRRSIDNKRTPRRRRSRSMSRPGPGSLSKSKKGLKMSPPKNSWKSRYSLKKAESDNRLSINQLLGRRIHNLSSNKYKFVSANSSPKKCNLPHQPTERRTYVKGKIGKFKRTKCSPRQATGKMVHIGGVLYKSSRSRLRRTSQSSSSPPKVFQSPHLLRKNNQTLVVRGAKFKITQNGCTLKRIGKTTPGKGNIDLTKGKRYIYIGGVSYTQTRPGTLVKNNQAANWISASRSISRSIATAVSAARMKKVNRKKQYCMFYNRFAKCNRGEKCPFVHDPDKVAVCTRYLRGTCKVTDCPFSHKVAPEKMPVCMHYLRGVCSRDNCPYLHANVSKDAQICQEFVKGYCPLGDKCKKKHSLVCPDNDGQGACPKGKDCKLKHPKVGAKRPGTLLTATSVEMIKPRSKRLKMNTSVEADDLSEDDLSLPLRERRLPSFILIESDDSDLDESRSNRRRPYPGPIQIRVDMANYSGQREDFLEAIIRQIKSFTRSMETSLTHTEVLAPRKTKLALPLADLFSPEALVHHGRQEDGGVGDFIHV